MQQNNIIVANKSIDSYINEKYRNYIKKEIYLTYNSI